jgi:hypothetical protein
MSFFLKPLAYLSASALSVLGLLSTKSKTARYYFHLSLYVGALGFCSFLGVLYGIFGTILGQVSPGSREKSPILPPVHVLTCVVFFPATQHQLLDREIILLRLLPVDWYPTGRGRRGALDVAAQGQEWQSSERRIDWKPPKVDWKCWQAVRGPWIAD